MHVRLRMQCCWLAGRANSDLDASLHAAILDFKIAKLMASKQAMVKSNFWKFITEKKYMDERPRCGSRSCTCRSPRGS